MSSSAVSAVQAARNLSRGYIQGSYDVRKKSMSHTDFNRDVMKIRSKEKQVAMAVDAKVTKNRENNEAAMEALDKKLDHSKDMANLKKQGRQVTGAIKGATRLAGALLMPEEKPIKPTKADYSAFDKYYSDRQKQLDVDRTKPDSEIEAYDPNKKYGVPDTGGTRMAGGVAAAGTTGQTGSDPVAPPSPPASSDSIGAKQIADMAAASGSKYPKLVAAQWALESDWGKTPSGKNNYFGIKATSGEASTAKGTWEVIGGQEINTTANFKNYDSPQGSVDDLVSKWHKDYGSYTGVNSANSAADAADALVRENYATDPNYATKLKDIMNRFEF